MEIVSCHILMLNHNPECYTSPKHYYIYLGLTLLSTTEDTHRDEKMVNKEAHCKINMSERELVRVCACAWVGVFISSICLSWKICLLFFFLNAALFYFSDLARQMRSGQTISCRNCIKCSICGVRGHWSFHVLSSHTKKTFFFPPLSCHEWL